MSIGYFEAKGGDLTPSYQIDFRLYANGVSRELFIDYGDFSIHGTLTSLEYLKAPDVRFGRQSVRSWRMPAMNSGLASAATCELTGPLWALVLPENPHSRELCRPL